MPTRQLTSLAAAHRPNYGQMKLALSIPDPTSLEAAREDALKALAPYSVPNDLFNVGSMSNQLGITTPEVFIYPPGLKTYENKSFPSMNAMAFHLSDGTNVVAISGDLITLQTSHSADSRLLSTPDQRIQAMIGHELAHLKNKDIPTSDLQDSRKQEIRADMTAIKHIASPVALKEALDLIDEHNARFITLMDEHDGMMEKYYSLQKENDHPLPQTRHAYLEYAEEHSKEFRQAVHDGKLITNRDIIKLIKADVSEDIVITFINDNPAHFELNDRLVLSHKVPPLVMNAMKMKQSGADITASRQPVTALRDIKDSMKKVLTTDAAGGRNTSHLLAPIK